MALPVTITGITATIPVAGPFKSSGGNFYFIGVSSADATKIRAYKATDPTSSWSNVGTDPAITNAVSVNWVSVWQDGDTLHVATASTPSTSTNSDYYYKTFDMSSDAWTAINEAIATSVPVNGSTGYRRGISICKRSSSGYLVAAFPRNYLYMSTNYNNVWWSERLGTNNWTVEANVNQQNYQLVSARVIPDPVDDRVLFCYSRESNNKYTDVLSSADTFDSGTHSNQPTYVYPWVYPLTRRTSEGTTTFITGNAFQTGGVSYAAQRATSADSLAWTATTTSFTSATNPIRVFPDGTDIWVLYRDSANDLYVRKSTDLGVTFGNAALVMTADVAQDAVISIDADRTGVLVRGSDYVIPFFVNDNGTLKYNEYAVRAATSNVEVSVPQGNLALDDTLVPTVLATQFIDLVPTVRDLLLGGFAPTLLIEELTQGISIEVSQGNVIIDDTYAPVITHQISFEPTTVDLALASLAPAVVSGASISVEAPQGAVAITGSVPTLAQTAHVQADPLTTDLVLTGATPIVAAGAAISVEPIAANLVISTLGIVSPTNMTSDTAPAPYVTSHSSEWSGYPAFWAFDGNAGTFSHAGNTLLTEPYWIKIDLGLQQAVLSYKYQARAGTVYHCWKTWVLEGSNNNVDWTLVDTVTNEPDFSASEIRTFTCDAPGSFRYWRWTITVSGGAQAQYAEEAALELHGGVTVDRTDHVWVTPTTVDLAIAAATPTIDAGAGISIDVPQSAVALTGTAPTVALTGYVWVNPPTVDLILSSTAPVAYIPTGAVVGAWQAYYAAKKYLATGDIDLDSHSFRIALFTNGSNAMSAELSTYSELTGEIAGTSTALPVTWDGDATIVCSAPPTQWNGELTEVLAAGIWDDSTGKLLLSAQLYEVPTTIPSGTTLRVRSAQGLFDLTS